MAYVNGKMNLTVRALMSVSDAESLVEVNTPIAVAYLKKLKVFLIPSRLSVVVLT